jgi:dUTP pyrophosphatase
MSDISPDATPASDACSLGQPNPTKTGGDDAPKQNNIINIGCDNFPPQVRFVIERCEETAPLYRNSWLLGPGGNENRDSGVDICAPRDICIPPGKLVSVRLGVRVVMLNLYWNPGHPSPMGCISPFLLLPKSSLSHTDNTDKGRTQRVVTLVNSPGLIDSGYRGELIAQLHNSGGDAVIIKRGKAILQVASPGLAAAEYCSCEKGDATSISAFPDSVRGKGSHGSTGERGSCG